MTFLALLTPASQHYALRSLCKPFLDGGGGFKGELATRATIPPKIDMHGCHDCCFLFADKAYSHSLNPVFLHIPHREMWILLASPNHYKHKLVHRHIERPKDMIGDRNCNFIQPLLQYIHAVRMVTVPNFLAASPAHRMVCDIMRLSRRMVVGERSEAYDMIEDTQHPPPSDQLPRQSS